MNRYDEEWQKKKVYVIDQDRVAYQTVDYDYSKEILTMRVGSDRHRRKEQNRIQLGIGRTAVPCGVSKKSSLENIHLQRSCLKKQERKSQATPALASHISHLTSHHRAKVQDKITSQSWLKQATPQWTTEATATKGFAWSTISSGTN
jgi:hypothetical protein